MYMAVITDVSLLTFVFTVCKLCVNNKQTVKRGRILSVLHFCLAGKRIRKGVGVIYNHFSFSILPILSHNVRIKGTDNSLIGWLFTVYHLPILEWWVHSIVHNIHAPRNLSNSSSTTRSIKLQS
jgi:hypothetical protein